MRVRSGVLIAVLGCGWLLGATPPAAASKCKQTEACRNCYDQTLSVVEGCAAADALIEARQARTLTINTQYNICAELAPGRPGSCTLTIRALNKCGRTRLISIGRSWTLFKAQARLQCGRRAVRAANRARRQCLRDESCPCSAPPTTSTTTTTTSTTTSSTTSTSTTSTTTTTSQGMTSAWTPVTPRQETTSTTTTTTTTTSSTASTVPVPPSPNGSACQQACIKRVAGGCYADCRSSCGRATGALPKCQRSCRNAQCSSLRSFCAPGADTNFDSNNPQGLNPDYFACCKINAGECDTDDQESLSCETTTTVTSTTSTSSITTTTLSGGVTTTTITGTTSTTTTTLNIVG